MPTIGSIVKSAIAAICIFAIFFLLRFVVTFPEFTEFVGRNALSLSPHNNEYNESPFCQSRNKVIPKKIHQMGPPDLDTPKHQHWKAFQRDWVKLYGDSLHYQYMYWTDELIDDFILQKFPEQLHLYLSYGHNVQRYDMARYLILYHFGGIYVDLDIGPSNVQVLNESLVHSETEDHPTSIVVRGLNGATSNDLMTTAPQSSFFKFVISNLEQYNKHWILPYLTVMGTTGPLFFTEQMLQYNRYRVPRDECVQLVGYDQFKVRHGTGNSWHQWDAGFILTMHRNLNVIKAVVILVVLFVVLMYLWRLGQVVFIVVHKWWVQVKEYWKDQDKKDT